MCHSRFCGSRGRRTYIRFPRELSIILSILSVYTFEVLVDVSRLVVTKPLIFSICANKMSPKKGCVQVTHVADQNVS